MRNHSSARCPLWGSADYLARQDKTRPIFSRQSGGVKMEACSPYAWLDWGLWMSINHLREYFRRNSWKLYDLTSYCNHGPATLLHTMTVKTYERVLLNSATLTLHYGFNCVDGKTWISWMTFKRWWSATPLCYQLTLNVRGPIYLGLTRSISWLLMPWRPGHQQPWYWLCRICRSLSYLRKNFN